MEGWEQGWVGNTKLVSQKPSKALGLEDAAGKSEEEWQQGPKPFRLVLTSVSLIVISILSAHESAFGLQKWPTRKLAQREEMCVVFLGPPQKNVSC